MAEPTVMLSDTADKSFAEFAYGAGCLRKLCRITVAESVEIVSNGEERLGPT